MAKQIIEPRPPRSISLTPTQGSEGATRTVLLSQLLTYAEERGFTRLRLVGGLEMQVRETTDQIDRLVRTAATRSPMPFAAAHD